VASVLNTNWTFRRLDVSFVTELITRATKSLFSRGQECCRLGDPLCHCRRWRRRRYRMHAAGNPGQFCDQQLIQLGSFLSSRTFPLRSNVVGTWTWLPVVFCCWILEHAENNFVVIYEVSLAWGLVSEIAKRDYQLRHMSPSVRLSVRMEQLGSLWTYSHEIWYLSVFSKICRENSSLIKLGQD